MNNSIKGLPQGSFSAVWTSDCSFVLWGKNRDRFLKFWCWRLQTFYHYHYLCEEMVILLEPRLEHHRLHQVCVFMLSHFSCVQLCRPMNYNPPDSSVHGILQARILEWVAISFPRDPPNPGIKPESLSPALVGGFFTTSATWEALHQVSSILQWCTHRIACLMGLLLYSRFLFMGDCTFAEMMSS